MGGWNKKETGFSGKNPVSGGGGNERNRVFKKKPGFGGGWVGVKRNRVLKKKLGFGGRR
jgi:hypothetical protein